MMPWVLNTSAATCHGFLWFYLASFLSPSISVNWSFIYAVFIHMQRSQSENISFIQEYIPVGCVPPAHWPHLVVWGGVSCVPWGGMCARGHVCLGGGVTTRGQNSWHKLVKTLPSRNYCCGKVISSQSVRSCIELLTRTYSVATTLSQSQFEGRITFACVEYGLTLPKFILVEGGSHPGKTSTHFPSVAARWKRNSCLATLQTQGQFANSISNE